MGRNVRQQDQKPALLMGIMPWCTWKCEGRYTAAAGVLELTSGVTFRSPEASSGSVQEGICVFLLHNSLSCSPAVSDCISESALHIIQSSQLCGKGRCAVMKKRCPRGGRSLRSLVIPELEITQSCVWGKESNLSYDWEIHLNSEIITGFKSL